MAAHILEQLGDSSDTACQVPRRCNDLAGGACPKPQSRRLQRGSAAQGRRLARTVVGRQLADPVFLRQAHAEHLQRHHGAQGETHDERLPHLGTVKRRVGPPLQIAGMPLSVFRPAHHAICGE